ncbi:the polygalacturonase [Choiromyces venosus 120613-1]|uniref:endo-polygalacturonase n=1 Tax=Choiromyces venosus 120613-1 TaxID=1336337 RepID=A0A3N4K964_9PEZI|nr:the polygalacturonase [Choiromyces venosus 120613-1]
MPRSKTSSSTKASSSPSPSSYGSSSCTITSASDLATAKATCTDISIGTLTVPAGQTLDLTGLLEGTKVTFTGTVTFGYKEWKGPLVSVDGTNIQVIGAPGSVLDGDGKRWWDGLGGNGGKAKPKFFSVHSLQSSTITGITLKNTPVQAFSINTAESLVLSGITIDNKDGDAGDLGHNTDAFDVGASNDIVITGATVYNQDDCLAVNSGTNIKFLNGFCSGGHGISIGSVGGRSNNDVDTVTVQNSTIVDSMNGVRIKTISGATGSVKGVTYSGITLKNISKYGIVIQQDYLNGKPTGTPTNGVPITDLTIENVCGDVAYSAIGIYILCAKGACSDWNWTGVNISGGDPPLKCSNIPSELALSC